MGIDPNEILALDSLFKKTEGIKPSEVFNTDILGSGVNQMVDEAQLDEPVIVETMQPSL